MIMKKVELFPFGTTLLEKFCFQSILKNTLAKVEKENCENISFPEASFIKENTNVDDTPLSLLRFKKIFSWFSEGANLTSP